MFDDVLNRCIEKWHDEDIPLSPPIDAAEVRRVWTGFGQRISRDVLQLYGAIGGFAEYTFDEEFFWCFWPWDVLQEQNAKSPGQGIQFCDHSINIVTWELRFEDERCSSVWALPASESRNDPDWFRPARPTAEDLESFFQMYLDAPWQLM